MNRVGAGQLRSARRFFIVTHRWLSLLLGIVLLAITTSGAILVYRPEVVRALNADAYEVSGKPAIIDVGEAMATVKRAHPTFEPTGVWEEHGVMRVTDYTTSYTVDPGTGRIAGFVDRTPAWLGFMDNVHECFLSCEDYPGYLPALAKEVPGTTWLGHEDAKVTWGALVLGAFGLVLLYLTLTGLWLWFPRPGKWKAAVTVRWKRGRFARDTDLHNIAGLVSLPLLAIWAFTGAGYELEPVEHLWHAATPSSSLEETYVEPLSEKSTAPDISMEQAVASARAFRPHDRLVNIDLPAKDDPTGSYTFYFQDGYDPWGNTEYPGEVGVFVDRHTGEAKEFYGLSGRSTAEVLWDDFNFPVHTGFIVNGWWRFIWFVLGLAPLLLAFTGVSTWLVRRRSKRSRRLARRSDEAESTEDPELVEVRA